MSRQNLQFENKAEYNKIIVVVSKSYSTVCDPMTVALVFFCPPLSLRLRSNSCPLSQWTSFNI